MDFMLWFAPRIALWIALSWLPMSKIMSLSAYGKDNEHLGTIGALYFVIFFVLAPLCLLI